MVFKKLIFILTYLLLGITTLSHSQLIKLSQEQLVEDNEVESLEEKNKHNGKTTLLVFDGSGGDFIQHIFKLPVFSDWHVQTLHVYPVSVETNFPPFFILYCCLKVFT